MKLVAALNDFLWAWGVSIPILIFGIFATIALRFPALRMFKRMIGAFRAKAEGGGASPFGVLCLVVGGQIGTGNMVGVAAAITTGGPGALFWMWVTAFLGMTTMFVETVLGQLFKEQNLDGTYRGGSAYYLAHGAKMKKLAVVAALVVAVGTGLINSMTHSNSITGSVQAIVPVNSIFMGVLLAVVTFAIIMGGLKSLVKFMEAVVPFMAVGYIAIGLIILILNVTRIPEAVGMIVSAAFNPVAVGGGAVGFTVQQAFRFGMSRGVFSNEAGQGSCCYSSSSSSARHPVTQGLLGSAAVAIDTLLVCTVTGMIVLLSGVDFTVMSGAELTQAAFAHFLGGAAPWVIAVALFFFAYTSLLASIYCSQNSLKFIFGDNKKIIYAYFALQLACVVFAPLIAVGDMFLLVDLLCGLMSLCNLVALFYLFKPVKATLKDYEDKLAAGDKDPSFDWNAFRNSYGLEPFKDLSNLHKEPRS